MNADEGGEMCDNKKGKRLVSEYSYMYTENDIRVRIVKRKGLKMC